MNDEVAVAVEETPKGGVNIVLPIKAKIKGRGVVKRADGSVRYDDPALKGSYDESHNQR